MGMIRSNRDEYSARQRDRWLSPLLHGVDAFVAIAISSTLRK
jgi:hypothetical protein